MTSIENLFSNLTDLTKTKSINDYASEYKSNKSYSNTSSPALTQGEKYKKYQKKIKKNLEKKIDNVNSKEGFGDMGDNIQFNPNGLTIQTTNIIKENDYSSQQQTIANLQQQYDATVNEYENLVAEISGSTLGYINRVNPNNPYLGKNIQVGAGIMYVTQQGVAKWYPNPNILTSTAGKNGCPSQQQIVNTNLPWSSSYETAGATIPTKPPLITGTPMTAGQSCGNEGVNVFVNKLVNNPTISYKGCYADNRQSPVMTFIGGSPPPPSGSLQNGNFAQPQIANNSYQYISSNTTVPGWNFYAVLINNSSAWGYPMPYPSGSQAACIQSTQIFGQYIQLSSGTYTLTFYACGRPGYSGANKINVYCVPAGQNANSVYTFTPPITAWQKYTTTINIQNSGNYAFGFNGTIPNPNNSTAIQNIQLTLGSSSSSSGSYTYNQCKEAAIDAGYQYFALQGVNTGTSKGYCAVSDNEPLITSLGPGMVVTGQTALWASNTVSTGSTASIAVTGSLTVYNAGGQAVFSTPNKSTSSPPGYVGCYVDNGNRAMNNTVLSNNTIGNPNGPYNWGMNVASCKQRALDNNFKYYAIQAGSVCFLSNDLNQTTQYGKANNCSGSGDNIAGGGWANAVYSAGTPPSNYFLILQDDGNMVIYKGNSPSDQQAAVWATGTNGQQNVANPVYAASQGKYGKNWIPVGSTLAAGDFVGSNSGNMALIMQSDGNLVLYTFTIGSNCQKMSDGNTGGGVGANALYNVGIRGIQKNMGQVAYIDQNSELHPYQSSNVEYGVSYTKITGNDSYGNDIPNAAYGNATVQSCQSTCNDNPNCAGFAFSNNICFPKNSSMYPNGAKQLNPAVNLYVRNKNPSNTPIGVPVTTRNTDSVTYGSYVNGGQLSNEYGLANATSTQKQQLEQLESQLNLLASQLSTYTTDFGEGSYQAAEQSRTNVTGIQDYLQGIKTTNRTIKNMDTTNVDNILKDSDIVVLQKNYDYLFWSILAVGSVLVTMNISKN